MEYIVHRGCEYAEKLAEYLNEQQIPGIQYLKNVDVIQIMHKKIWQMFAKLRPSTLQCKKVELKDRASNNGSMRRIGKYDSSQSGKLPFHYSLPMIKQKGNSSKQIFVIDGTPNSDAGNQNI